MNTIIHITLLFTRCNTMFGYHYFVASYFFLYDLKLAEMSWL